jgi:hypothetical protein
MKNRGATIAAFVASLTFILVLGQGCQGSHGTSTGNPLSSEPGVALKMAAFSPTAVPGNNVLSLAMCLKRLRFKAASGSSDSGDIDLQLGDVTLDPSGTLLSSVQIPIGTFDRIEFDLDPSCSSGHSVALTNSSGSFTSTDDMTIRFDGSITITGDQSVELLVQQIVNALATVTSGSAIKSAAEGVSGSF